MAVLDVFSKTEGQLRAEQALQEAEDRLLAYHDQESTDLAYHARRDADRMKVVVGRQRLTHEMVKRTSRQNVCVTLAVGAILLIRGAIDPEAVMKALSFVFHG